MRLGIDFGTTRTVVAFADRGNYPVVVFEAPDRSTWEWFPPLAAVQRGRRLYGWEAWAAQEESGWTVVRSLKRELERSGPETLVEVAGERFALRVLLREMAEALRKNLLESSSLPSAGDEALEVMLGVPANANSNQRYLTVESFREGGFQVLGLLNEPSAASIEFGHRDRAAQRIKDGTRLLVYDMGGGTFDASLVEISASEHAVIASAGVASLGGDDFDEILAEMALEIAGVTQGGREALTQSEVFLLHEECRQKKEALHPNTRHLVIDLGLVRPDWEPVTVPVGEFYERCRPLIEESLRASEALLDAHARPADDGGAASVAIEALYVTGGGSELPLVSRMLREVFGRRVRRSAYTRSATAIGLSIQADAQSAYRLRDQFTRYFGVWREADSGHEVVFDPLFSRGMKLPSAAGPPLVSSRKYFPAHNVGHFRYLECTALSGEGRPAGDITVWDDIRFPFDPALRTSRDLVQVPVARMHHVPPGEAEENYACDSNGMVAVTITSHPGSYSRQYKLSRWSAAEATVKPGRLKKRRQK